MRVTSSLCSSFEPATMREKPSTKLEIGRKGLPEVGYYTSCF